MSIPVFTRSALDLHLRPWFNSMEREKIVDVLFATLDEAAQLDEGIDLGDLADVDITDPEVGHVLSFDGTDWVNAALPTFDSGTYTPTITATSNSGSTSINPAHYMRVGNIVTVTGTASLAATASGNTLAQASLTLPPDTRTTDFVNSYDVAGVISSSGDSASGEAFSGGEIRAISGSQLVQIRLRAATTVATRFNYTFTFPVVD